MVMRLEHTHSIPRPGSNQQYEYLLEVLVLCLEELLASRCASGTLSLTIAVQLVPRDDHAGNSP